MKTVYLSGPIAGLTYDDGQDWRTVAEASLKEAGIQGLSPLRAKGYLRQVGEISGHGREYADMGVLSTPKAVLARDHFDATRCDVLLVNLLGAKRVSIGTVMEIAFAYEARIPIVCAMESGVSAAQPDQLSWLAAMIDGEGCVYVVRRERQVGASFEAIDFRVDSLEEALYVVKTILV